MIDDILIKINKNDSEKEKIIKSILSWESSFSMLSILNYINIENRDEKNSKKKVNDLLYKKTITRKEIEAQLKKFINKKGK